MPGVFLARAVYYRMIRWQYFLYDFCYFANASAMMFLWRWKKSATVFRCIFAFANGPVLLAIPLWRNSLVFHSGGQGVEHFRARDAVLDDLVRSVVRVWGRCE